MFAPHGGLKELVDRMVPEGERAEFTKSAAELPKLPVSDADLSSLYRFGDGGLSPLEGPMTKEVFDRVLDEEVIINNGEKYAWTIPIAFPASYEVADSLKVGQKAALVNGAGELVGTIDVEDVYPSRRLAISLPSTAPVGSITPALVSFSRIIAIGWSAARSVFCRKRSIRCMGTWSSRRGNPESTLPKRAGTGSSLSRRATLSTALTNTR